MPPMKHTLFATLIIGAVLSLAACSKDKKPAPAQPTATEPAKTEPAAEGDKKADEAKPEEAPASGGW